MIDISKTDAARNIKLDKEMLQDESWKPVYYNVKRSKAKVTSHKSVAGVGLCTLVSAGFFWLCICECFNKTANHLTVTYTLNTGIFCTCYIMRFGVILHQADCPVLENFARICKR